MSIKKIPFLYIYDNDEDKLTKLTNLSFERLQYHVGTSREEYRFFANNYVNHKRIEICEFADRVFYNFNNGHYVVWMNTDDERRALYLIGLKLLEDVDRYVTNMKTQLGIYTNLIDGLVNSAKEYNFIKED